MMPGCLKHVRLGCRQCPRSHGVAAAFQHYKVRGRCLYLEGGAFLSDFSIEILYVAGKGLEHSFSMRPVKSFRKQCTVHAGRCRIPHAPSCMRCAIHAGRLLIMQWRSRGNRFQTHIHDRHCVMEEAHTSNQTAHSPASDRQM